jgi:signal transduction histidine kinase
MELAIFRLVQECLTNIHRHSGSKTAQIRVAREGESVRVEVRDHGKGIPPDRLLEIQSHGAGVGIRGIRERIRQFHGEMKIESNSSGTSVIVSIPVPNEVRSPDSEPLQAAV